MNRLFRTVGLVALVSLAAVTACVTGEKGSGTIKTDARTVPAFTEVDVGTGLEADVSIGALAPVEVRGDDNLVPFVVTEVDHGRLSIHMKGGVSISPTTKIHAHAVAPKLDRLECGSGASLAAEGLKGDMLDLKASSGGSLRASGATTRLSVNASSGAHVEAGALAASEVEATVSSGAHATVQATSSIRGSSSSGASLRVKGTPAKKDVTESSGGSVKYE